MIDRKAHALELQAFDAEYRTGALVVAGMDEVGRGPLAGNVVTACVVIPENPLIEWIDDSKKLSESRREKVYDQIMANALYVGIGQVLLSSHSTRKQLSPRLLLVRTAR